jgi:prepilin-type N-terminal cleavage/methylation domain-containing protein
VLVKHTRAAQRGFTLTELMVVVVITGLLASLGFASLRSQVKAAWSAEATSTMQGIRAAEERWRTEYMMYADVSTAGLWYPGDPSSDAGEQRPFFFAPGSGQHPNQEGWLALRPTVAGPARFGYLVNAGVAGEVMTVPSAGSAITWPVPPDNWYVIQAIGDTDGDGVLSYYRASSLNGDVFVENPGE